MTDPAQPAIRILQGADEYFPALIAAIDTAQTTVYLESYLISDDAATAAVIEALIRAQARGVAVFMLLDGFGASDKRDWIGQRLEATGIELEFYRPGVRFLAPHTWRRLHRKLVLIDERISFVGGVNLIGDRYDLKHGELNHPRLDFSAEVSALRVVRRISWTMRRLWWRVSLRNSLRGSMRSVLRHRQPEPELQRIRKAWRRVRRHLRWRASPLRLDASRKYRLFLRDNVRYRRSIENWYLQQISSASRDILIANAYFVPTLRFRRALMEAAARGVRVRLLLQGNPDQWWTQWASQALADELVAAGIEIYDYQPSFLHAKAAVIDDWLTVGSSNIDPFSLMLSLEANVMAEDPPAARDLTQRIEAAIEASRPRTVAVLRGEAGLGRRLALTIALAALRVFLAFSGGRFRLR